jgi:hypothetical protein
LGRYPAVELNHWRKAKLAQPLYKRPACHQEQGLKLLDLGVTFRSIHNLIISIMLWHDNSLLAACAAD